MISLPGCSSTDPEERPDAPGVLAAGVESTLADGAGGGFFSCRTTDSSCDNRSTSCALICSRLRLGARPRPVGYTLRQSQQSVGEAGSSAHHSIPEALAQLLQGCCRSHLTFRWRHTMQLRVRAACSAQDEGDATLDAVLLEGPGVPRISASIE